MKAKTILVTGGAGFIGSNLAINLAKENPNITIISLDNLKRRGSETSLQEFRKWSNIRFFHGDIRNDEDLQFKGKIDLIIECSAEPSVLAGHDNPKYLVNTNLLGTINCLELARKHKAAFIFLSTSRVYPVRLLSTIKYSQAETRFNLDKKQAIAGVTEKGISESFPLEGYRSLYGTSKLASEFLINEYAQLYGLSVVINRCGLVAGPRQMGKTDQGVVTHWIIKHLWGKEITYIGFNGSGKQVRDVLHVSDLYNALKWQIANLPKVRSNVFNLGGGPENAISLFELTTIVQKVTGKTIKIKREKSNRRDDIPLYITDYSKFHRMSGWKPKITPTQTVKDIFSWLKSDQKQLKPILNQ